MHMLRVNYSVTFPDVNAAPLLWKCVREASLPREDNPYQPTISLLAHRLCLLLSFLLSHLSETSGGHVSRSGLRYRPVRSGSRPQRISRPRARGKPGPQLQTPVGC